MLPAERKGLLLQKREKCKKNMELKELTDRTKELFDIKDIGELGKELIKCEADKLSAFYDLIDGDLSKDYLQMIYQYYMADRKEKKQDYTPACLGKFLSKLLGEADTYIDMCAGSGALTIQLWNEHPDKEFELEEIDENVIPYLLFNLCLRNVNAIVKQKDIIADETTVIYNIRKGENFASVSLQSAL